MNKKLREETVAVRAEKQVRRKLDALSPLMFCECGVFLEASKNCIYLV